jgi:integrase
MKSFGFMPCLAITNFRFRSDRIFNTSNDTPLSLHNVVNRQILPTLEERRKLDETVPQWHGFHAASRGIGTNLNRLGVDDTFIQKVLRHSDLTTTQTYYIKATDKDKQAAMEKYEAEIDRMVAEIERLKQLRATIMPPADSALEKPKFVN